MQYKNPIIPGFYPDPSICKGEEYYYLVTSSFEYFPGVPIFRSKDLINWEQIGHCLTRESQLPLKNVESSGGIWAPTLRYHKGLFYMITTNMPNEGHFFVTATDPAGEWSEPIWIKGEGFDPDLFFDDDGKVYFMEHDLHGKGITQWEIDIQTGEFLSEGRCIWAGMEDRFCEGAHMYKINGEYYLMVAEGGTHYGHMIVMARGESATGEFYGCPHNPILTHRHHVLHDIQCLGHGDLIQVENGSWWIVFLGTRPIDRHYHLGRETFLAPVEWDEKGWPVVNQNQPIDEVMITETETASNVIKEKVSNKIKDDFKELNLKDDWNFRRENMIKNISLNQRKSYLTLLGTEATLSDKNNKVFIGRRQQHFDCKFSTRMEFNPGQEGEEAGITVIMNEQHHYEIALTYTKGKKYIAVKKQIGDISVITAKAAYEKEIVEFVLNANEVEYELGYRDEEGEFKRLDTALVKYLSPQTAGGFTGVYLGMYATGNGEKSNSYAYFDWAEYEEIENK